ncbi:hypothetical protein Desal_1926 [Maridesulfovibrio salexigens DSM 2638]|uniref:BON domain-containing protein n=2 Tax=Maridesulfovibrio salexigens TaxID=880 RepID=C6BUH8_MARSD|nr:hypothetical protein Desal_1926 [Maridesulfovibrio salexigens DSM 2638]
MHNVIKYLLVSVMLVTPCLIGLSAEAGFVPYGRIFKAVKDERPYITQAQDSRLQMQLHKTILLNCPASLANISSYVYSAHAFLVGEVENDAERDTLINSTKEISGLYGLSYFLPQKKITENNTSSELEIKLKGFIDPKYPSSKVAVKVVQNNVIILGVLAPQEQESVTKSLQEIAGTTKIINFLQEPQQQKKIKKRFRPIRNLFGD